MKTIQKKDLKQVMGGSLNCERVGNRTRCTYRAGHILCIGTYTWWGTTEELKCWFDNQPDNQN